MAKTKTPFLSLGSSGTVGGALTSQKRGGETILRGAPRPTDPYSLAQAYQRWDYKDYAHLWTLLTNSQKQVYRTRASRYHITGFSLWMREHLKDLADILSRWHLDEATGIIAFDSSKNANDGAITGALPATGLIAGCRLFDGVDDLITIPASPSLWSPDFSIEIFLYPIDAGEGGFGQPLWKQGLVSGFNAYMLNAPNLRWGGWWAGAPKGVSTTGNKVSYGAWHHIVLQDDESNVIAYVDNQKFTGDAIAGPVSDHTAEILYIGAKLAGAYAFHGYIDEFVFRGRRLTEHEIQRHSERRYTL